MLLTVKKFKYGDIYHEGLIPSFAVLRDLTQYKYAKQTTAKTFISMSPPG